MNGAAKKIMNEITQLLDLSEHFLERYNNDGDKIPTDLYEDLSYFVTRCSYLFKILNKGEFGKFVEHFEDWYAYTSEKPTYRGIGEALLKIRTALKTTRREIENGLIFEISHLAKAEVFDDLLEYGKNLLDGFHVDAAAVIIGTVLENLLRETAIKNNLPIESEKGKKLTLQPLNESLCKAGIYDQLLKNRITTQGIIRNHASHGEYDKYVRKDVETMYDFVCNLSLDRS